MSAPWLMLASSFLFALMGVCVKLASQQYSAGEIVFYRGVVGACFIAALVAIRGGSLRTPLPSMHLRRSLSGVSALALWFFAIGQLPLSTAITLNYMSSVWMAVFMVAGALFMGRSRVPRGATLSILAGFVGVALVLQPSIDRTQWLGALAGLASGLLSAAAYLQVTTLGRAGEPEYRVVFYFSLGGTLVGLILALANHGFHSHTDTGLMLLGSTGVLATAAQMLMTRAYAIGKPLSNACLQYLGIVHATVFGVLLFNDPMGWLTLAGMALIVGAGLGANLARQAPSQAPRDAR